MIARAVLRAHQLRSLGAGQRYLVEREWLSDHRVMQRVNDGVPEPAADWKQIGRWLDIEKERAALATQGWEIDDKRERRAVDLRGASSRERSGAASHPKPQAVDGEGES